MLSPTPRRSQDLDRRADVDNLINNILADRRPGSTQPGSPAVRATRPTSVVSAGQLSSDTEPASPAQSRMVDGETQTISLGPLATVYESAGDGQVTAEASTHKEVITYSKGVQASIDWSPARPRGARGSDADRDDRDDRDDSPTRSPRSKRQSRRQKERDEEIRSQLRKEIEDEIKAAQQAPHDGTAATSDENYPFKTLTNEELTAVENSEDFIGFVERSTKVLERALDQQLGYDILADYALDGIDVGDDDEGYGTSAAKKGRRIKEVAQFWDERWSKKRMVSDLGFSTKVRRATPSSTPHQLTVCAVPRARPGLVHQEPLRSQRPRWPGPSLEHAHARPARVHIPRSVGHSHCKILPVPPKPHHRWCILGPGPAMGHSRKVHTRPKDTADRLWTHASRLLDRHCRNPKRKQHHLLLHRRRRLWLDSRHAYSTTRVPRTHFAATRKNR